MKRPLCLICLAVVILLAVLSRLLPQDTYGIGDLEKETILLQGQVCRTETKNDITAVYLEKLSVITEETSEKVQEISKKYKCICYLESPMRVPIGSTIIVRGTASSFQRASNPGEFDLNGYYDTQNICFQIRKGQVLRISRSGSRLRNLLQELREACAGIFSVCYDEADAGTLSAMLLGDKASLDQEVKSLYQRSGIAHILAISGLHISLLGMGCYELLRRCHLPYLPAMLLCILLMWLFGMMTGNSASTVRAILMFGIRLAAVQFGRTYDMLTALAVAALFLVLQQPEFLFYAGFQMSFAAIVGLGCVQPVLQSVLPVTQKHRKWFRPALASLSIAFATMPIVLWNYYEYPLYSILLNLAVLPTVGIVIVCGLLTLLLGAVSPALTVLPVGLSHLLLEMYERGAAVISRLPGHTWITGRPGQWNIVVYVLIFAVLMLGCPIWKCRLTEHMKKRCSEPVKIQLTESGKSRMIESIKRCCTKRENQIYAVAVIGAVGMALLILTWHSLNGIRLTALDVGQGDGNCIETAVGHAILVDCGSTDEKNTAKYKLIPFLKYRGIHTIDCIFLTHLDADHTCGILELLASESAADFQIERIVLACAVPRDEAYEVLIGLAQACGIPVDYMQTGDIYEQEDITLTCLHPAAAFVPQTPGDRNAASLILRLDYREFNAIYTGDADCGGEVLAMEALDVQVEYLKVGHHGSATASSENFLDCVRPVFATISCGQGNSYGHPAQQTLDRLQEYGVSYAITMESGAVTIRTDGRWMWVDRYIK